jgi:DNA polymerase-3 subunit epsilon
MSVNSSLFSIVDIEATGSDPSKDRIIECAVVTSDGSKIIDHYSTLIDPGISVPPFITGITGITNELLTGSPSFNQVASDIYSRITDTVFVAHNVTFDYNFLKGDLDQFGYDLSLPTICSCRTARKLLRGFSSYSLQNLASSLQISHKHAHRALDDAMATTELFHILYQKADGDMTRFRSDHVDIPYSCPIQPDRIRNLPNSAGIVWFNDSQGQPIHISKARNIKQRAIQKLHKFTANKFHDLKLDIDSVDFEVTGSYTLARIRELEFLSHCKPRYNKRQPVRPFKAEQRLLKSSRTQSVNMSDGEQALLAWEAGPSNNQNTLLLLRNDLILGYLVIDREETVMGVGHIEDRFTMFPSGV